MFVNCSFLGKGSLIYFFKATLPLIFALMEMAKGMQTLQQQQPNPVVRARRGAKHSEGKSNISLDNIMNPEELQAYVKANENRIPGSNKFTTSWRGFCTHAVDSIRYHLHQNLPYPADPHAFSQLFYDLGTAADRGEMPSFGDDGARAAYALEFFCRARLVADLIHEKYNKLEPSELKDDVYYHKFCTKKGEREDRRCKVVSLGGGPGYDFLSILLADYFGNFGHGTTTIEGVVFDYEEGWKDLVEAMDTASKKAFVNISQSTVQWGGACDITKSLRDPCNAACLAAVESGDIFICQYCVAENAVALRESNFVFFVDLFQEARNDSTFIFTEVTPRIWPDIVDVLLKTGQDNFSIDFARALKRKVGPQLIIQKRQGLQLCPQELAVCQEFREIQAMHDRKIEGGFQRQPKKIRGSKVLG